MEALLSDSTDFSHILLNLVNNLIYDYFCCISLLFHSKWRIYKSSWNQQHWNVNWSHHQFPYQHHRLHCITTRPDRFGHTNSISNHYRLTHSFTGKLWFWSWFTLFLGVFDFDSHFLVYWKKKFGGIWRMLTSVLMKLQCINFLHFTYVEQKKLRIP